ncbi:MAG: DnaJ family molecular chaperone [Hyphomicrobiales bacterium]|nr:DnaJ family molecular chaperone [Hyphomicrobiales bacterium]
MGIWDRIGEFAGQLRQRSSLIDAIAGLARQLVGDRESRRQLTFTMAMIALSAKMAKADGVVTADEIRAFEQLFEMPAGQEANIARMFDLARQDVAGYDRYAAQIAALYKDEPAVLADIVEGLFHIAKADGVVHEAEDAFLYRVAGIFGISDAEFGTIRARHVVADRNDPYVILGADRSMSDAEIRRHYRRLVAENHPDRHIALGMPEEFIRIATEKLAAINEAYDRIAAERRL